MKDISQKRTQIRKDLDAAYKKHDGNGVVEASKKLSQLAKKIVKSQT